VFASKRRVLMRPNLTAMLNNYLTTSARQTSRQPEISESWPPRVPAVERIQILNWFGRHRCGRCADVEWLGEGDWIGSD